MNLRFSIVLSLCFAILCSCSTSKKSYQSTYVINQAVQLDPIKADIVVDERNRLKGHAHATYFFGLWVGGNRSYADGVHYPSDFGLGLRNARIKKVRSAATFNALSTGNFDLIVHPQYSYTVENYLIFKKYLATVEGYGANYENFRTEKQKIVILPSGEKLVIPEVPE